MEDIISSQLTNLVSSLEKDKQKLKLVESQILAMEKNLQIKRAKKKEIKHKIHQNTTKHKKLIKNITELNVKEFFENHASFKPEGNGFMETKEHFKLLQ